MAFQEAPGASCLQELCPEPPHWQPPSPFSTFLHPAPNGCLLQLVPLQPLLLHFPPVQSSFAIQHIAFCLKCPRVLPPLCPPPQPLTSTPTRVTTAAGQELSATLHTQDATWHGPALGYNAAANEIKSDDSICSICCKCRQTDSATAELLRNPTCSLCALQGKLPLPGCCAMA